MNLEKVSRVECYDVSNMQGKSATGSMVVFIGGTPDKSQYKKFRIRMENEPNDIAMLKETLQRRFSHPGWIYPEIILIDGGKAQLDRLQKSADSFSTSSMVNKINDVTEALNNIPTDIVYTSKVFFAVNELIKQNYFKSNSSILVIHSGGLQGNRSVAKNILNF